MAAQSENEIDYEQQEESDYVRQDSDADYVQVRAKPKFT